MSNSKFKFKKYPMAGKVPFKPHTHDEITNLIENGQCPECESYDLEKRRGPTTVFYMFHIIETILTFFTCNNCRLKFQNQKGLVEQLAVVEDYVNKWKKGQE